MRATCARGRRAARRPAPRAAAARVPSEGGFFRKRGDAPGAWREKARARARRRRRVRRRPRRLRHAARGAHAPSAPPIASDARPPAQHRPPPRRCACCGAPPPLLPPPPAFSASARGVGNGADFPCLSPLQSAAHAIPRLLPQQLIASRRGRSRSSESTAKRNFAAASAIAPRCDRRRRRGSHDQSTS